MRVQRTGKKLKGFYMHREIAQAQKGDIVDHINYNPLDNRRENLRKVTYRENMFNRYGNKKSSSVYTGVHWHDTAGKFAAQFNHKHIGYFATEDDAALAYNSVAFAEAGTLAHLNKVRGISEAKMTRMPMRRSPKRYRGVRQRSFNCWEAYIQYAKHRYVVGYFNNEREAALAYNAECDRLKVKKRKNEGI